MTDSPGGEVDVTIIIPNVDGARPLDACLASIAELDFPAGHRQVLVVDGASKDRSRDVARTHGATVLELASNLGFAAAINAGAAAATTPLIALLNNDMVVEPGWLRALVDSWDPAANVRCVGGAILSEDGTRSDFAGGVVNFHGFGDQPGFGSDAAATMDDELRGSEPFACGGSMLIDRELFLEVGAFDESYFAYFEDVDLGWRLNLLGHDIAYTPRSRCLHRHHGTSRRMSRAQRQLLLERNALQTILKNVDEATLGRILGPALMLLAQRALDRSRSRRDTFRPFRRQSRAALVPSTALATLHAVGDVLERLPDVMQQRQAIQSRRVRPDVEIVRRLGAWAQPIGATSDAYRVAFANILDAFEIR